MDGVQQFRCPCCGTWLWTFKTVWQRRGSRIIYCDGCAVERDPAHRTGPGKNQCKWYQDYPQAHNRWSEPKPEIKPFGMCIR